MHFQFVYACCIQSVLYILSAVGTVWMAVRYHDTTVSELIQFKGDRNQVIESATNHVMFMLIKMLRNSYIVQEEINDD